MNSASDNFAWACCGRWAEDRARFALYCGDAAGAESAWTFWDIQREANRFANVLGALGVMRGERVALLLGQRAETAALHVACGQMGAVAVPLPRILGAATLAEANARVAVVDSAGAAALAAARTQDGMPRHAIGVAGARGEGLRDWAALRPLASPRYVPLEGLADEPALLLGAGTAAATELTHSELARQADKFLAAHPGYPQPGDLFWSPADWATAAGLLEGVLAAWCHGQPAVAYDGDTNAAAALGLIAKYDVRNVRLTPHQLEAIMAGVPRPNETYDCRLRTVATGGAAPGAPLAAWLKAELGVVATGPAEESEA
jgi:acetyl-CoA synthetase